MSTTKASAPERELRGRQCTEQEPSDQAETARSQSIVNESGAHVNVSRRSRIVPALVLGLSAFAVCYLVGHLAAALVGWRFVIYGGFALGLWFFAACIVAFIIAGAVHRD